MALFCKCKVILVLEFSWILYIVAPTGDTCNVTIKQEPFQEIQGTDSTVNITCSVSASKCPGSRKTLWFRYLAFQHEDLCTLNCNDNEKFKFYEDKTSASLQINKLTVNDFAMYICGIAFADSDAPSSKKTGAGTLLVNRGTEKYTAEEYILMIILSTLLFLYSITIFAVIMFYKSKSKLVMKTKKEDLKDEYHKNMSGRTVCRAIAQELYKKRYAKDQQQPDCLEQNDTIYQNR